MWACVPGTHIGKALWYLYHVTQEQQILFPHLIFFNLSGGASPRPHPASFTVSIVFILLILNFLIENVPVSLKIHFRK